MLNNAFFCSSFHLFGGIYFGWWNRGIVSARVGVCRFGRLSILEPLVIWAAFFVILGAVVVGVL